MFRMNTTSTLNPLHELARSAAQALGLSSAWALAAAAFAALFVVFLVAFIVAEVHRRKWRREADALGEYRRGIEACAGMDLQPILSPDGHQVDSIVFQRVNAPADPLLASARADDASAQPVAGDGAACGGQPDALERIRRLEQRLGRVDAGGGQPVAGAFPAASAAGAADAPVPVAGQAPVAVPLPAQMPVPVASEPVQPVPAAASPSQARGSAPGKTASFHIGSGSVTIVGRDGAPAPKDAASGFAGAPAGAAHAAPYSTTSFPRVSARAGAAPARPSHAAPSADAPAGASETKPDDSMGGKIPRI